MTRLTYYLSLVLLGLSGCAEQGQTDDIISSTPLPSGGAAVSGTVLEPLTRLRYRGKGRMGWHQYRGAYWC